MKNKINLLLLLMCICSSAIAQKMNRKIDISVSAVHPTKIHFIKCPAELEFKVKIINKGIDTLNPQDRFKIRLYSQSSSFYVSVPKVLLPKDSLILDFKTVINRDFDQNDFRLIFDIYANNEKANSIWPEKEDQWIDNYIIYEPIMIRTSTSSIDRINNNTSIDLYPNPAKDYLNFQTDIVLNQSSQIEIFTSQGTSVYSTFISDHNRNIDISHLEKGVYNFVIYSEYQCIRKRFIKIE